ncbi:S1 RNA-binding domain-containing protein [Candidatus Peregrinibacteria bacterium]|nr:S1 RNA-binding domain-containing protein [Candidatus Peregrinibacteria bacterium]
MYKIVDPNITMEDILGESAEFVKPQLGAVVTGTVVSVKKNHMVVDLNGVAVGIASGKETHDSLGTFRSLKEGDEVKAVVIDEENEDGMVVLSLKKASQSITWDRFEAAFKNGDLVEITVSEANKGGLLVDVDGIKGFIPVSQLAPVHYPRVEDADAGQILSRLQKLVGIKLIVKVINLDRSTGKMILSEKAAIERNAKDSLGKLNIGETVEGTVSGVVKFGIFVTFDGLEGLVHISEIAWGHVSNPHQYARVGDKVKVMIIGIEGEKLSLSIKRLTPDPWAVMEEKYPIGTKVKGTINRFSPFGAFVQLKDDINGLIHLSEISNEKVEKPEDFLSVGQEVEAQVINIDRDEHRIGLSIKALTPVKKKAKAEEKKEEEPKEEPKAEEAPAEEAKEEVKEEVEKEAKEEKEAKPKKAAAKKEKAAKTEEKPKAAKKEKKAK